MKSITVTLNNPNGLHLRVAAEIVRICKRHNSRVVLSCAECENADGCSILSLLTLGAKEGTELTIRADGSDESETVNEFARYFTDGGGI